VDGLNRLQHLSIIDDYASPGYSILLSQVVEQATSRRNIEDYRYTSILRSLMLFINLQCLVYEWLF
jgi:hypothetical protein